MDEQTKIDDVDGLIAALLADDLLVTYPEGWDYRVARRDDGKGNVSYFIVEAYYSKSEPERVVAITKEAMPPYGETLKQLKVEMLKHMARAFKLPVIDYQTRQPVDKSVLKLDMKRYKEMWR